MYEVDDEMPLNSSDEVARIARPIAEIARELTQSTHTPTAQVILPSADRLQVHLVNISDLQHLDEARNDVNLLQTIFFTALGVVVGFLTNTITSPVTLQTSSWMFLSTVLVFTVTFGLLWARAARRAAELRNQLYGKTNNEPNHSS